MSRIDPFTRKRIEKFIETHRKKTGELPTLNDFSDGGFDKLMIENAIKDGFVSEFYVTLTNGVVKKGYKIRDDSDRV